jgi:hypothetical protein
MTRTEAEPMQEEIVLAKKPWKKRAITTLLCGMGVISGAEAQAIFCCYVNSTDQPNSCDPSFVFPDQFARELPNWSDPHMDYARGYISVKYRKQNGTEAITRFFVDKKSCLAAVQGK